MIIRSQDKTKIINFNTTCEIYKQGFEIWLNTYNGISKIGTYSTEEKAIKVLDMICEHATELHFSTIVPDGCGEIYGNVFQMPSDEEVEV